MAITPVEGPRQVVVPSDRERAPRPAAGWRSGLPVLSAPGVALREVLIADAPALFAMLACHEVSRFISPPPQSVEAFERFVRWAHRARAGGHYVCFAVVPEQLRTAVGLFQVRQVDPGFVTAEWGFALGVRYWGSGLFPVCASLVARFAFDQLGVHRLEARAAVANARGNGALVKIGAVREGLLGRSLLCHGQYVDQFLWTILDDEWRRGREAPSSPVH